jgi:hypothetical protein
MQKVKFLKCLLVILALATCLLSPVWAQNRHNLLIGTQFPVQWTAGYEYNVNETYSLRGQFGLLTPPYDKFIIKSMEAFGFNRKYSRALDESFEMGIVATLVPQYRFGNNYIMVQGQYASLSGSITLQRAVELYLDTPLPDLSGIPFLPILAPRLTTRSNLFLAGLGYGRRFPIPDTRFSVHTEVAFSKIFGSGNQFQSNLGTLDNLSLVQNYYQQMNNRLKDSYRRYGYVPSLSVYLVYHLDGQR